VPPGASRTVERRLHFTRPRRQLKTTETAGVLGISEQNVKVRLHRARHALRDAL
jgi:DNA-directed RNA polymerase specialized sigma24 family protein